MDIADFVARNPATSISIARIKAAEDDTDSVAVCALMIALARHLTSRFAACIEIGTNWRGGLAVRKITDRA